LYDINKSELGTLGSIERWCAIRCDYHVLLMFLTGS